MNACQLVKQFGPLAGRVMLALIFHNFWAVEAAQFQNQMNHFLKNVCILGGMLYVMAYGPGPLSLDRDDCGTS